MNKLFLVFIIGLFTINLSAQNQEEQAIIDLVIAMWDAMEEKDVEKYMSYYHPTYTSFGEYSEYLNEGKDFEKRSISNSLSYIQSVHTEMHHPKVNINGNTAWITYYWSDYGVARGKAFKSKGKSSRIFVKEKDKWLCIHSHFTLAPE
jgi:ketosteroid isomerase-like protein